MPETLEQMARRMCGAYVLSSDTFRCDGCPLDAFNPCASTALFPDQYPDEAQIIRDWAAAHPPEEVRHAGS